MHLYDQKGSRSICIHAGPEVEMGACWIHGSSSNHPITQLANKYSLGLAETTDEELYVVDESTGQEYTDDEQTDAWTYVEQVILTCNDPGCCENVGKKRKVNTVAQPYINANSWPFLPVFCYYFAYFTSATFFHFFQIDLLIQLCCQ